MAWMWRDVLFVWGVLWEWECDNRKSHDEPMDPINPRDGLAEGPCNVGPQRWTRDFAVIFVASKKPFCMELKARNSYKCIILNALLKHSTQIKGKMLIIHK